MSIIKLITGGMYSGKTFTLITELERARYAKKKVVLVRPNRDSRYFLSHSGLVCNVPQVFLDELGDLPDKLSYDVVGVDEGQFFKLLAHDANYLANNGVKVIISALNGTSEQEPFESIQDLIPFAEEIEKKSAVCMDCGSEHGSFSFYKGGDKDDKVKIGAGNEYVALCRLCYNKRIDLKSWN